MDAEEKNKTKQNHKGCRPNQVLHSMQAEVIDVSALPKVGPNSLTSKHTRNATLFKANFKYAYLSLNLIIPHNVLRTGAAFLTIFFDRTPSTKSTGNVNKCSI